MQKLFGQVARASKNEPRFSSSIRKFILTAFSGLALLASPMLAHKARAEAPPIPSQEIGAYALEGPKVTLKNGKQREEAHFCAHSININCILIVNGPADVTVLYYPIIPKVSFKTPGPIRVSYSLDGTNFDQDSQTSLSNLRTTDVDLDKSLGVGSPIEISFTAMEGSHKFLILTPKGFLKVEKVEAQVPMPPLVPLADPENTPPAPAQLDSPATQPPKGSPGDTTVSVAAKIEKPKTEEVPIITLDSDILRFAALGEDENAGHIANVAMLGRLSFDNNFGLLLGSYVKRYRLALEGNNHKTDVTLTSGGLLFGPSVVLKSGRLSIMALVGRQSIDTDVNTEEGLQGITVDRSMPAELGLRLQYDSDLFKAMLEASNNPVNPGMLRLAHNTQYIRLPTGTHPELELDARLLHLLRPNKSETPLGSSVDDRTVYLELLAEAPFTFGPVTVSLLGGGESLVDSGPTRVTGLAGGGLEFHVWRLRIGGRVLLNPAEISHLPRAMVTVEFLSERTVE